MFDKIISAIISAFIAVLLFFVVLPQFMIAVGQSAILAYAIGFVILLAILVAIYKLIIG